MLWCDRIFPEGKMESEKVSLNPDKYCGTQLDSGLACLVTAAKLLGIPAD